MTPKERVRAACARWGEAVVVRDCVTVLRGGRYPDDEKWLLLGGPAAPTQLKSPVNGLYVCADGNAGWQGLLIKLFQIAPAPDALFENGPEGKGIKHAQ